MKPAAAQLYGSRIAAPRRSEREKGLVQEVLGAIAPTPSRGAGIAGRNCVYPLLAALGLALCAGCAESLSGVVGRSASARTVASPDDTRAWEVPRPDAAASAEARRQGANAAAAPSSPTVLPAYAVRETAFSDFGMSVKTNFDVQWGGRVAWMVVTAIDAGSSAARQRLGVGDRILALDGRQITTFDRDAMLAALFHRKQGETSRLLVLGPKEALPRFVVLVAHRP